MNQAIDCEWEDCWSCGGEGGYHDCGEDTCCCLDPDEITHRCSECKGEGGWMVPFQGTQQMNTHPPLISEFYCRHLRLHRLSYFPRRGWLVERAKLHGGWNIVNYLKRGKREAK